MVFSGSGSGSITQTSAAYADGDTLYFKLEKTCNTVFEAVSFSISYHL